MRRSKRWSCLHPEAGTRRDHTPSDFRSACRSVDPGLMGRIIPMLTKDCRALDALRRWTKAGVLLGGLMAFAAGCAGWLGPPADIQYDSPTTRHLMDGLAAFNADLPAVKGVGRVVVATDRIRQIYERAAWVGAEPGRLRFAFRGPAGLPMFSMSCDPQWITALNHPEGTYVRREIGDNSLARFLPVAIKCGDLVALLMGRPPRVAHDGVRIEAANADEGHALTLALQRRFRGTVGRLQVDRASGELQAVELMDIHGNRLYEARLGAMQTVEGYRLPTRITVSGPDGSLALEVSRCWPESSVPEDVFHIVPPSK